MRISESRQGEERGESEAKKAIEFFRQTYPDFGEVRKSLHKLRKTERVCKSIVRTIPFGLTVMNSKMVVNTSTCYIEAHVIWVQQESNPQATLR